MARTSNPVERAVLLPPGRGSPRFAGSAAGFCEVALAFEPMPSHIAGAGNWPLGAGRCLRHQQGRDMEQIPRGPIDNLEQSIKQDGFWG
jgi:hypothetical protein